MKKANRPKNFGTISHQEGHKRHKNQFARFWNWLHIMIIGSCMYVDCVLLLCVGESNTQKTFLMGRVSLKLIKKRNLPGQTFKHKPLCAQSSENFFFSVSRINSFLSHFICVFHFLIQTSEKKIEFPFRHVCRFLSCKSYTINFDHVYDLLLLFCELNVYTQHRELSHLLGEVN